MNKVIKVGAAQIAPKFFDKQQTLEKACQYIEEGGKLGLDLLVFPEVYFCGYPLGRRGGSVPGGNRPQSEGQLRDRLQ